MSGGVGPPGVGPTYGAGENIMTDLARITVNPEVC